MTDKQFEEYLEKDSVKERLKELINSPEETAKSLLRLREDLYFTFRELQERICSLNVKIDQVIRNNDLEYWED